MENQKSRNPFEQIANSLGDGVKTRFGDPFLGTYSIAFLIFNYQILLYIFSDLSPDTKYALIQRSINLWSFVIPALVTFAILLIVPWTLLKAYKLHEELKIRLENIRQEASLDLKTTANKISYLEQRVREETDKTLRAQNLLSDKDQEIGALKNKQHLLEKTHIENSSTIQLLTEKLNTLETHTRQLSSEKAELEKKLNNFEQTVKSEISEAQSSDPTTQNLIKSLINSNLYGAFEDIAAKITVSNLRASGSGVDEKILAKFNSMGLTEIPPNPGGYRFVKLTQLGKRVQEHILKQGILS